MAKFSSYSKVSNNRWGTFIYFRIFGAPLLIFTPQIIFFRNDFQLILKCLIQMKNDRYFRSFLPILQSKSHILQKKSVYKASTRPFFHNFSHFTPTQIVPNVTPLIILTLPFYFSAKMVRPPCLFKPPIIRDSRVVHQNWHFWIPN